MGLSQPSVQGLFAGNVAKFARARQQQPDQPMKRILALLQFVTGSFVGPAQMEMISAAHPARPSLSTVFVSMRDEQSDAVFALRSGARGLVTKSESANIVEALERLRSGQVYFSQESVAKALASEVRLPMIVKPPRTGGVCSSRRWTELKLEGKQKCSVSQSSLRLAPREITRATVVKAKSMPLVCPLLKAASGSAK